MTAGLGNLQRNSEIICTLRKRTSGISYVYLGAQFLATIVGRRSETISLRLCLSCQFKNEGKFYVLYYEYEIFMRNARRGENEIKTIRVAKMFERLFYIFARAEPRLITQRVVNHCSKKMWRGRFALRIIHV